MNDLEGDEVIDPQPNEKSRSAEKATGGRGRQSRIPIDAPEADALEQERDWDEGDAEDRPRIPIDAPEADVLEQSRAAGLDEDDRGHD